MRKTKRVTPPTPEEVEFVATVKNLMRSLCKGSRLPQKVVAKRLEVSQGRLNTILDRPSFATFARLLTALGYKPTIGFKKLAKAKTPKKVVKKASKVVKVDRDESHPQPVPERV